MINKTTMSMQTRTVDGKPAVALQVRGAEYTAGMIALCDELGIVPVADISNLREIICTSETALLMARKPLLAWVVGKPDAQGRVTLA